MSSLERDRFDLKQKAFVVTGASSGIGAATALELASRGASVVLHGRGESDAIREVANRLSETHAAISQIDPSLDARVDFLLGDFSMNQLWSETDWDQFVSPLWQSFDQIDGWVNNAGGDVLTGPWKEKPLNEKLAHLWQVDVVSTLMLSRVVGKRMIERNTQGTIINIGWDQAAHGMGGESGELFATTKGAIMAMSKSLAQSFAPNVRVNCVAPGWIQTKWGEETSEYWNDRAQRESLSNRWGRPIDVAKAIAFLCSDESNFISGQVIPVNGGFRFNQMEKGSA